MRTNFYLRLFITGFIVFLFQFNLFSQEENASCKVLLSEISEVYNGDCKDGFAHGKGIARGIDIYQERFKKGLPHGTGKYIWKDGSYYEGSWKNGKKSGRGFLYTASTNEELKGIWKDDEFYKEIVDPPYEVSLKTGITGVNFHEDESKVPHRIELVFQKDGSQARSAPELNISSTTGQTKTSGSFSGFENVLFPFEGTVEFVDMSRMGTTMIRYELKFKITKASSWKVVIRY